MNTHTHTFNANNYHASFDINRNFNNGTTSAIGLFNLKRYQA